MIAMIERVNMNAISTPIRTKYDCNVENRRDYDFRTNLAKRNFDHCSHIWPVLKEIAIIFGPYRNLDCIHIWSLFIIKIAIIFSPKNN